MNQRHEITEETAVLKALSLLFPDSSNTTLRHMLRAGRVRVDGQVVRTARLALAPHQILEVSPRSGSPSTAPNKTPDGRPIRVIHEDQHVLLLSKPAGLLTVATDSRESDTLHSRAQAHVRRRTKSARVHIVHRLDKRTSGLLVFARSEEAKWNLQTQFSERTVQRIYYALVEGHLQGEGTIHNHLFQSQTLQVSECRSTKPGAREAITHWEAVAVGRNHTLVRLKLGTGRRHQIRVHMANLGHPVAGDPEHGVQTDPLNRLCLHAWKLEFDHPHSGERQVYESRLPRRFSRLAARNIET